MHANFITDVISISNFKVNSSVLKPLHVWSSVVIHVKGVKLNVVCTNITAKGHGIGHLEVGEVCWRDALTRSCKLWKFFSQIKFSCKWNTVTAKKARCLEWAVTILEYSPIMSYWSTYPSIDTLWQNRSIWKWFCCFVLNSCQFSTELKEPGKRKH